MRLRVAETFYSIQGEGEWTGTAAFFIRLAGCNLNCEFCDTRYEATREATINGLITEACQHPARKVVITGGEPALQDTQPLVVSLRKEGFKTHVETNGTTRMHMDWDWVTVSPKPGTSLDPLVMSMASEVKFLCGPPGWEECINKVVSSYRLQKVIKWILPLAKAWPHRDVDALLDHNVKQGVEYCLQHPQFKLCTQIHKVVGVR